MSMAAFESLCDTFAVFPGRLGGTHSPQFGDTLYVFHCVMYNPGFVEAGPRWRVHECVTEAEAKEYLLNAAALKDVAFCIAGESGLGSRASLRVVLRADDRATDGSCDFQGDSERDGADGGDDSERGSASGSASFEASSSGGSTGGAGENVTQSEGQVCSTKHEPREFHDHQDGPLRRFPSLDYDYGEPKAVAGAVADCYHPRDLDDSFLRDILDMSQTEVCTLRQHIIGTPFVDLGGYKTPSSVGARAELHTDLHPTNFAQDLARTLAEVAAGGIDSLSSPVQSVQCSFFSGAPSNADESDCDCSNCGAGGFATRLQICPLCESESVRNVCARGHPCEDCGHCPTLWCGWDDAYCSERCAAVAEAQRIARAGRPLPYWLAGRVGTTTKDEPPRSPDTQDMNASTLQFGLGSRTTSVQDVASASSAIDDRSQYTQYTQPGQSGQANQEPNAKLVSPGGPINGDSGDRDSGPKRRKMQVHFSKRDAEISPDC